MSAHVRDRVPGEDVSARVLVGDWEVAALSQRTFTWFTVNPGTTEIQAIWPAMSEQVASKIEMNLEAGRVYYIELTGEFRVAGIEAAAVNQLKYTFRKGSGMNERAPEVAEATLSTCCRFVAPSPASDR